MRAMAGLSPEERLRRWQYVTAATLLVGYTGYYLCRSNLSVAAPLMLEGSGPAGFSRQTLGLIASAGALTYALGKFVTGVARDFVGGRRGSATAAGLIDTAGYLGAVLSGYMLGAIVESQGWPAVFLTLASVGFASVLVVWVYTREHAAVAAPQRLSI